MIYEQVDSPIGKLTIISDGLTITGLHIEGDRYFGGVPTDWRRRTDHELLNRAAAELDEFFNGQRVVFSLPLVVSGTVFQQSVWRALQDIPHGSTTTYSNLAEVIGRPKAVRAVGSAVGRNPICIIVPCHRVIAGDGSMGGYVAGLERKAELLKIEGVTI